MRDAAVQDAAVNNARRLNSCGVYSVEARQDRTTSKWLVFISVQVPGDLTCRRPRNISILCPVLLHYFGE
jgi:hypothetical protein